MFRFSRCLLNACHVTVGFATTSAYVSVRRVCNLSSFLQSFPQLSTLSNSHAKANELGNMNTNVALFITALIAILAFQAEALCCRYSGGCACSTSGSCGNLAACYPCECRRPPLDVTTELADFHAQCECATVSISTWPGRVSELTLILINPFSTDRTSHAVICTSRVLSQAAASSAVREVAPSQGDCCKTRSRKMALHRRQRPVLEVHAVQHVEQCDGPLWETWTELDTCLYIQEW